MENREPSITQVKKVYIDDNPDNEEKEKPNFKPLYSSRFRSDEITTTDNKNYNRKDAKEFWECNTDNFSPGKYVIEYNNFGIEKIYKKEKSWEKVKF